MRTTLGIDIGTSAVKVVAVGEDGNVLARASRLYQTKTPRPGCVEQSPRDWWTATASSTREVVGALGRASIVGVGLSGQLNGFVLLDKAGEIPGDVPIWLDTRAVAEAQELEARFGDAFRHRARTELSAIAVLPKLAWMAHHRPDILRRARRVLFVKDYVLWRLTGVEATDPSDASATAMMDVTTLEWMPELCTAAGLHPDVLPPIRPSCGVAGQVRAEASRETGIPAGVPVISGGGDVAALAVGCGVVAKGVLGITLGTAGHVVLSETGSPQSGTRPGFWQVVHADPALSVWLGLVMSGGLSLSWFHRVLSAGRPESLTFADMVALAGDVPPGACGLSFIPFLEGAATPYSAPLARASLQGLSSSHGAAEMVQAVMEGVAFNVRECVELFEELGGAVREIRIAEGGARVDRWCQIIADVLQRPISRIEEADASALGAAVMAHAGILRMPLKDVVRRIVRQGDEFLPQARHAAAYQQAFGRYRRLSELEVGLSRDNDGGRLIR